MTGKWGGGGEGGKRGNHSSGLDISHDTLAHHFLIDWSKLLLSYLAYDLLSIFVKINRRVVK